MYPNLLKNHWSEGPNAPEIPDFAYLSEKANFSGNLIGAIFYGIAVVLFFQCMTALLNPINHSREGVRWGLVANTAVAFSFVTILTATDLDIQSVSYIDYREFPGGDGLSPGPHGYLDLLNSNAINLVPNIMFILNTWLTDGLLLYRCCAFYAMNYWVTAFPCLMYLASLATGSTFIYYQASQPVVGKWSSVAINFNFPYFAISFSLNVLLTFMIVIRLVLHSRKIRDTTETLARTTRLYNAVATMLVESFALYAVSFLLFIGAWGAVNHAEYIFFPILAQTQVIAPFLIIRRIANRSSFESNSIALSNISTIRFRSQGNSTGDYGTLTDPCPTDSMSANGEVPRELGIGFNIEAVIEEIPL